MAKFQQIADDLELRKELLDLRSQQLNAARRALQPLGDAHEADVVPHDAAQPVTVVRDLYDLVSIGDREVCAFAAFVAWTSGWGVRDALPPPIQHCRQRLTKVPSLASPSIFVGFSFSCAARC